MGDRLRGFVADSATWIGANLVCSAAALLTTYLAVTLAGGSRVVLAPSLAVAGVVSLTWGSWISLSWTRNRPLRVAMKAITLIPGTLLMSIGGLGLYSGLGPMFTWLLLIASALGTMAVATLLWRELPYTSASRTRQDLAVGFFVYPLATSIGAALVFAILLTFVQSPFETAAHQQFELGLVPMGYIISVTTALAVELATTVIPASVSMFCARAGTPTD